MIFDSRHDSAGCGAVGWFAFADIGAMHGGGFRTWWLKAVKKGERGRVYGRERERGKEGCALISLSFCRLADKMAHADSLTKWLMSHRSREQIGEMESVDTQPDSLAGLGWGLGLGLVLYRRPFDSRSPIRRKKETWES